MTPINIELFPCAGGMAEGFKRAGVHFDLAIEWMENHVDSYEQNIGHRPVCMDVRDFVRMLKLSPLQRRVRLIVADPPCTPWSRSGKRLGTDDHRDMLRETCELIRLIKPDAYLIGNVPGLDDGPNLHVVQALIGSLSEIGYCSADFARLNAANYGVPQHRIRPFWFGHLGGPCIMWPEPTHGDPTDLRDQLTLPMVHALKPWITCGQALGHLTPDELGRPVKLRKRGCNGKQHGSVGGKPARVVGTSNLCDGNVMLPGFTIQDPRGGLNGLNKMDAPSHAIVRNTHGNGCILTFNEKHPPSSSDQPAGVIGGVGRTNGATVMVDDSKHPSVAADEPSTTIRGGGEGHSAPPLVMRVGNDHVVELDDDLLVPEVSTLHYTPNHPPSFDDEPAMAVRAGGGEGARVALAINAPKEGRRRKRDDGRVGQGNRVGSPDNASATITAKAARVGAGEAHVLEWPWDRPATTVQGDDRLSPPGHHDENFAVMSLPNAVVISEKAATILQGFPDDWVFVGKSKKERWSQIGQAMPPPLAHAVATSVVRQLRATRFDVTFDTTPMAPVVPIDQRRVTSKPPAKTGKKKSRGSKQRAKDKARRARPQRAKARRSAQR